MKAADIDAVKAVGLASTALVLHIGCFEPSTSAAFIDFTENDPIYTDKSVENPDEDQNNFSSFSKIKSFLKSSGSSGM